MKIISKYKDYYDYLSGIWGEDPKLVLDRREFDVIKSIFNGDKTEYFTLLICGYKIDGVYENRRFYYGEQLEEISYKPGWYPSKQRHFYPLKDLDIGLYFSFKNSSGNKWEDIHVLGEIVKDKLNLNKKYNCPILITNSEGLNDTFHKFPILQDLNLGSYIPPKTIYKWLSDWFAQIENEKEIQRGGILTNKDKILSKGFDPKTSFRPKMKN